MDIGVTDITASEVKSFDRQLGHTEIHRGAAYGVAFMPMVQVEVTGTDRPGDGKVFVCGPYPRD